MTRTINSLTFNSLSPTYILPNTTEMTFVQEVFSKYTYKKRTKNKKDLETKKY